MWRWAVVVGVVAGCDARHPARELGPSVFPFADAGFEIDDGPPEPPPQVTVTGCWSAPIVVAPSSGWAGGSLAVLPSGDAVVAWVENAVNPRVLSRFVFRDGGVSATEEVYAVPQGPPFDEAPESPRLHANASEMVTLAWLHRGDAGTSNEVLLSTRPPASGWQPPERVNPELGLPIARADVGLDARGASSPGISPP